jgi:hypothetical protein
LLLYRLPRLQVLLLLTLHLRQRSTREHSRFVHLIRADSALGFPRSDQIRKGIFVRLHGGQMADEDLQAVFTPVQRSSGAIKVDDRDGRRTGGEVQERETREKEAVQCPIG